MKVIVIMGSPSDREFVEQVTGALEALGLAWEARVASAHKTPRYLLDMLAAYESEEEPKVYITVAGRSNALSGMVDAAVTAPVIACPPYSGKFAGADIYSSLRAPSGVAPAVVPEPSNAALLAAKMLGLADEAVKDAVRQAQQVQRERLYGADGGA